MGWLATLGRALRVSGTRSRSSWRPAGDMDSDSAFSTRESTSERSRSFSPMLTTRVSSAPRRAESQVTLDDLGQDQLREMLDRHAPGRYE